MEAGFSNNFGAEKTANPGRNLEKKASPWWKSDKKMRDDINTLFDNTKNLGISEFPWYPPWPCKWSINLTSWSQRPGYQMMHWADVVLFTGWQSYSIRQGSQTSVVPFVIPVGSGIMYYSGLGNQNAWLSQTETTTILIKWLRVMFTVKRQTLIPSAIRSAQTGIRSEGLYEKTRLETYNPPHDASARNHSYTVEGKSSVLRIARNNQAGDSR